MDHIVLAAIAVIVSRRSSNELRRKASEIIEDAAERMKPLVESAPGTPMKKD